MGGNWVTKRRLAVVPNQRKAKMPALRFWKRVRVDVRDAIKKTTGSALSNDP